MSAVENIKIERNVPMPEKYSRHQRGRWQKLVLKMKVGDSVLVTRNQAHSLYQAIRKLNHLGCMRKENSNKYRVWKGAKK